MNNKCYCLRVTLRSQIAPKTYFTSKRRFSFPFIKILKAIKRAEKEYGDDISGYYIKVEE